MNLPAAFATGLILLGCCPGAGAPCGRGACLGVGRLAGKGVAASGSGNSLLVLLRRNACGGTPRCWCMPSLFAEFQASTKWPVTWRIATMSCHSNSCCVPLPYPSSALLCSAHALPAGGQASNVATYVAHGDVALSVLMTAASTVAATIMTPTLTSLLAGAYIPVDGLVRGLGAMRAGSTFRCVTY